MFDSVVSKITAAVRTAARVVPHAVARSAWLAPAAILVFFLVW